MGNFQLAQEDAVTWLRSLPAGSVDLAITDPAYESLEKHRAKGTTTRLSHSDASSNDWFNILVKQSSAPGELVIDPFMGSGAFGTAALYQGRRFAGSDVSARSIEIARERLLSAGGVEGVTVRADAGPLFAEVSP